jgi:hypothetical protein
MARLPNYILDPRGHRNKPEGEEVFRKDTPSMDLEAERGLVADLLVQIGDRQEQLQQIRAHLIV